MAVPTQLSDLSATAASNSPAGSDTVGTTMDDFLRAHASIIARIAAGTDALSSPDINGGTIDGAVIGGTTRAAVSGTTGNFNGGLTVTGGNTTTRGISDTATATALTLSGSGANSLTIANSASNPTIGTSAGDLLICGSLLADTVASAVNYVQISGSAAAAGSAFVLGRGADTDVALILSGQGASGVTLATVNGTVPQVAITHTASANRYITLTGSYGGNPKIATSGGSLDIGSAVVFTGQTVGTTVGAAGGASALPATPLGYLTTSINGTACKIPYYN